MLPFITHYGTVAILVTESDLGTTPEELNGNLQAMMLKKTRDDRYCFPKRVRIKLFRNKHLITDTTRQVIRAAYKSDQAILLRILDAAREEQCYSREDYVP